MWKMLSKSWKKKKKLMPTKVHSNFCILYSMSINTFNFKNNRNNMYFKKISETETFIISVE